MRMKSGKNCKKLLNTWERKLRERDTTEKKQFKLLFDGWTLIFCGDLIFGARRQSKSKRKKEKQRVEENWKQWKKMKVLRKMRRTLQRRVEQMKNKRYWKGNLCLVMVCRAHVQKLYVLSCVSFELGSMVSKTFCFFMVLGADVQKPLFWKISGSAVQHTMVLSCFFGRAKGEGPMTPRTTWKVDEPSWSPPPTSSRPSLLGTSISESWTLLKRFSEFLGRFSEVSRKIPRHSVKTRTRWIGGCKFVRHPNTRPVSEKLNVFCWSCAVRSGKLFCCWTCFGCLKHFEAFGCCTCFWCLRPFLCGNKHT